MMTDPPAAREHTEHVKQEWETASDEAGTDPQRVWNAKLRGPDHTQCNVRGGLEAFTFGSRVL